MWCIFGLGDCDTDPDLAAVAYYYLVQTNFCVTIGDTWCWGGEDQGIDIWDPANNEMFYDDMYWTWYHPAQAWGLSEEDLRSRLIEDWFFESADTPVDWYFDDSHPATRALMGHEGVNKYRQQFYRSGCRDIGDRYNPDSHGEWYQPGDNTPLDRLLGESDLDRVYLQFSCEGRLAWQMAFNIDYNEGSVCGALGSYAVKIINNNDGTASFEVYNPTSWESFLRPPFEWMPTLGRPEREQTSPNWFCQEGCGGNVSQRFRWTEIILPGLCGYCPSWGPSQ